MLGCDCCCCCCFLTFFLSALLRYSLPDPCRGGANACTSDSVALSCLTLGNLEAAVCADGVAAGMVGAFGNICCRNSDRKAAAAGVAPLPPPMSGPVGFASRVRVNFCDEAVLPKSAAVTPLLAIFKTSRSHQYSHPFAARQQSHDFAYARDLTSFAPCCHCGANHCSLLCHR